MLGVMRVILQIETDSDIYEYARNRDWFTTVVGAADLIGEQLIVLVGFEEGQVEAAALLERQRRVATRKHLTRVSDFVWFDPLPVAELRDALPGGVQRHLRSGLLPLATGTRAIEALRALRPDIDDELSLLERRLQRPGVRRRSGIETVAMERDAVGLALDIAKLDRKPISEWTDREGDGHAAPFLTGMRQAQLREDQIVNHDVGVFGDWEVIRRSAVGAVEFEQDGRRLTVVNVNRMATENTLGVDLVYFHETFNAFVLVQYKRMHRETIDGVPRSVYRLDGNHEEQVRRMRDIGIADAPEDPRGYRLSAASCYFKLCNPETLDPYTTKLLPGMYLPLDYFELLRSSGAVTGPQGGVVFSYENVERRIANSLFVDLVQDGWVGSNGEVTERLRPIVEFMVENGRSVVLAVESERGAEHSLAVETQGR